MLDAMLTRFTLDVMAMSAIQDCTSGVSSYHE